MPSSFECLFLVPPRIYNALVKKADASELARLRELNDPPAETEAEWWNALPGGDGDPQGSGQMGVLPDYPPSYRPPPQHQQPSTSAAAAIALNDPQMMQTPPTLGMEYVAVGDPTMMPSTSRMAAAATGAAVKKGRKSVGYMGGAEADKVLNYFSSAKPGDPVSPSEIARQKPGMSTLAAQAAGIASISESGEMPTTSTAAAVPGKKIPTVRSKKNQWAKSKNVKHKDLFASRWIDTDGELAHINAQTLKKNTSDAGGDIVDPGDRRKRASRHDKRRNDDDYIYF